MVTYFTNKENSLLNVWHRESFIQLKGGREVSKTCQRQRDSRFLYESSPIYECLHVSWRPDFFTLNEWYRCRCSTWDLCFFVIRTLIAPVCKASLLSLTAQRGSCGARWHDPVTQTHSDSGNRPPEQKSSIISVQQLQPFIECVGVTCPPPCPIDFLWVTNTAHTLHFVSDLTDLRSGIA